MDCTSSGPLEGRQSGSALVSLFPFWSAFVSLRPGSGLPCLPSEGRKCPSMPFCPSGGKEYRLSHNRCSTGLAVAFPALSCLHPLPANPFLPFSEGRVSGHARPCGGASVFSLRPAQRGGHWPGCQAGAQSKPPRSRAAAQGRPGCLLSSSLPWPWPELAREGAVPSRARTGKESLR